MAHRVGNRIRETTSTTGTGAFTTTGAVANHTTLASKLTANGDTAWYFADNGTQWEQGTLTRTSATTFARTTIDDNSNGDTSAVNFTTAPEVFLDIPAKLFPPAGFAAFDVAASGAQGPYPTGTETKVLLTGTKEYDTENCFDSANSRFTAPINGVYEFILRMARSNPTVQITSQLSLYKNGSLISGVINETATWQVISAPIRLKLNAGDYIEMYFNPGADSSTSSAGVRLQGNLLRAL